MGRWWVLNTISGGIKTQSQLNFLSVQFEVAKRHSKMVSNATGKSASKPFNNLQKFAIVGLLIVGQVLGARLRRDAPILREWETPTFGLEGRGFEGQGFEGEARGFDGDIRAGFGGEIRVTDDFGGVEGEVRGIFNDGRFDGFGEGRFDEYGIPHEDYGPPVEPPKHEEYGIPHEDYGPPALRVEPVTEQ